MPVISFTTSNYVAREVGYNMTGDWMQGVIAMSEHFQPIATFRERFAEYLRDIRALGFEALDIWTPILAYTWVTDAHLSLAADLLREYRFSVASFAGGFGDTRDQFERSCKAALAVNAPLLGGFTSLFDTDRGFMVETLRKYGLRFAQENQSEKTPEEVLQKVGSDEGGVIGVCLDTGWFGTYGYDAADALRKVAPRLFHVHLKDVLAQGAHDTCGYGQGVVPIERCVNVLMDVGYRGAISIEHEPGHAEPTEAVRASFALLKQWLGQSSLSGKDS